MEKICNEEKSINPFSELADDIILFELLPFFTFREIVSLSVVSHGVFEYCKNDKLWKILAFRTLKEERINQLGDFYEQKSDNWESIFRVLFWFSNYCHREWENTTLLFKRLLSESLRSALSNPVIKQYVTATNTHFDNVELGPGAIRRKVERFSSKIKLLQQLFIKTMVVKKNPKNPEEKGEVQYEQTSTYVGEMANGQYEGYGHLQNEFLDPNQKWGVVEYRGNFKEGDFNGQGWLQRANGTTYEGEFLNGYRHGFGKNVSRPLRDKPSFVSFCYEGNFVKGTRHGYGKDTRDDIMFKGEWDYSSYFYDHNHFTGDIVDTKTGDTIVSKGRFRRGFDPKHTNISFHFGYFCDGCYKSPLRGRERHVCEECTYDFCKECIKDGKAKEKCPHYANLNVLVNGEEGADDSPFYD